jgi:hypothetical protein
MHGTHINIKKIQTFISDNFLGLLNPCPETSANNYQHMLVFVCIDLSLRMLETVVCGWTEYQYLLQILGFNGSKMYNVVVTPCGLIGGFEYPKDGCTRFLCKVGNDLPHYTLSYPSKASL